MYACLNVRVRTWARQDRLICRYIGEGHGDKRGKGGAFAGALKLSLAFKIINTVAT